MADKPTQCGALWRKLAKDEKTRYFSGVFELDGTKTFFKAFVNNYKEEGSNQPDYRLILDTPMEQTTTSTPKTAAKPAAKKVAKKPAPEPVEEVVEDEAEEVLLD